MSALTPLLSATAAGESLWLPDLRQALEKDPAALPLRICLHTAGGERRDACLPLVPPESGEEAAFLRDMLRAFLLNLLSACGGSELRLYLPEATPASLWELTASALAALEEPGYDKALRVSARLCAAAGLPPLRRELLPLSAWTPLTEKESAAPAELFWLKPGRP